MKKSNKVFNTPKKWLPILILVMAILFAGVAISAAQDKYPSRDINIIVPFGAGGALDLSTRIFADELSKVLNANIVVTNKPGATGTIGTVFALKSKNDGYTLLTNSCSGLVISHFVLPDVPFQTLRDLAPITPVVFAPNILAVSKDSAYKSFEDLIDFAKKNPGRIKYGTAGAGSDTHLVMEQIQDAIHVKFTHVPFKSGGEALTAILGGHVDLASMTLIGGVSNLRAGTIRALVMGQKNRSKVFPDIPTYHEKGYPQDFMRFWSGLFAPAGTDPAIIDVISAGAKKVTELKTYTDRIEELGASVEYMKPQEFKSFIEKEQKLIGAIVKQTGLMPKK